MSEPTGDSSSTPPPSQPPPPEGGGVPNNLTRAPRAKPPNVNTPRDAPPAGTPPGFSEFMSWMQSMGGGAAVEDESTRANRGVLPKEQKKFSRRTTEAAKPALPSPEGAIGPSDDARTSPPSVIPEGEKPTPAAPISVPADFLNVERKRRAKETSTAAPGLKLLTQFLVFALIIGSFFLGRATVPKLAHAPLAAPAGPVESKDGSPTGILPPELAQKVDDAMAAESAGDARRAQELLQEVKDAGGHVVGLNYHLALMAFANGELARVLPLLNLSISEGEEVAACYNLRGTMANRQGGVQKGLSDFDLAAKLDPFNAKYAFFQGEALRRNGKPLAALAVLRQALHRLREPALEGIYLLKIRMAQIELNQGGEFAEEMAANLALNPPPIDWVLTAAAVELHRGNIPAAASYFAKAKTIVPERDFLIRLRDYYFFSFSNEKELAPFFAPIKNPASSARPTPAVPVADQTAPVPIFNTPSAPLLDSASPTNLLKRQ